MDLGNQYKIIVPATLAQAVVSERAVSGKYAVKTGKGYRVATKLHYLSFFCILKAYSPHSGHIMFWHEEIDHLMSITNLSRKGIYNYLNKLVELELIEPRYIKQRNRLKEFTLISWERLAKKFELDPFEKFIEITYDKDNRDHHPKYLIIQAEILHNQDKQAYMIAKKCKRFKRNYAQDNNSPEEYIKKYSKKSSSASQLDDKLVANQALIKFAKLFKDEKQPDQCESEDETTAFNNFLRKINPNINRGLAGFMKAYFFTDLHRSIYLKKQLVKRKLGIFKQGVKIYSNVGNRAPQYLHVDPVTQEPTKKQMKDIFNRDTQQSGVWLADMYHPTKKIQEN